MMGEQTAMSLLCTTTSEQGHPICAECIALLDSGRGIVGNGKDSDPRDWFSGSILDCLSEISVFL